MKKIKWHHHRPSGSQHTAGGFVTNSPDRWSSDAQMVCHVYGSTEYGRLIAAAPEMLELLEGFMSIVAESNGVAGSLNGSAAEWNELGEVAATRALLDKIRGEKLECL